MIERVPLHAGEQAVDELVGRRGHVGHADAGDAGLGGAGCVRMIARSSKPTEMSCVKAPARRGPLRIGHEIARRDCELARGVEGCHGRGQLWSRRPRGGAGAHPRIAGWHGGLQYNRSNRVYCRQALSKSCRSIRPGPTRFSHFDGRYMTEVMARSRNEFALSAAIGAAHGPRARALLGGDRLGHAVGGAQPLGQRLGQLPARPCGSRTC